LLAGAQFSGMAINEHHAKQLIDSSEELLERASECASHPLACAD
jgi:hypothetical protein